MMKFLLFLSLIFLEIHAIATIYVDADTKTLDLSHKVDYFIDQENQYSFETLPLDQFWPNGSHSLNLGYSKSALWIRFKVQNNLPGNFNGSIEIPSLWIDHLHFYIKKDKELEQLLTGSEHPFSSRASYANAFFLPFSLEQNASAQIYIQASSAIPFILAPQLYAKTSAEKKVAQSSFYKGGLIGIILAMLLYNFILFLVSKDLSSLHYSFYLFALILFAGTFYGYNFQFFWPQDPSLNADLKPAFILLLPFMGLLFTRTFFSTKSFMPKTDHVLVTFLILLAILIFASFFIPQSLYVNSIALVFLSIYSALLIWISSKGSQQKIAGKQYFFLASLLFFLCVIFYILLPFGVFEYSTLTYYLFGIILIIKVLFFCIALRFRLRAHEQQTDHAHNQSILQKELSKLVTTDQLTELYTRTKLTEILHLEIQRAKRFETHLGVVLLDIDHFKLINDSFGEETGNTILKDIANLLQTHTRKIDTLGRWGDGKFLIICPGSDFEGTHALSEKLRTALEAFSFSTKQRHTASFGMTVFHHSDDEFKQLISRVESAVNQAKDQGRNKTVSLLCD